MQAFNTLRCRECAALGRELLGGNGIQVDFHVAKVSGVRRASLVDATHSSYIRFLFRSLLQHLFFGGSLTKELVRS